MLVAVASILLAGTWYLKEGESSFRVGSPAMKTYYAHSRMRIVDESATRALREQRMSDIGGVLVKDRKFPEEVRGKFAALEKRDYAAVLPDSLSRIMESLPEDAAERITGVASRIALSFQDSLSGERNFRLTFCGGALRPRAFPSRNRTSPTRSWITSWKEPWSWTPK